MLHLVQSVQGYVSQEGIAFCAKQLDLSDAEVSAVATFYTMYKRKPCGEHLVSVCTNTLCAAMGGDAIYKTAPDAPRVRDGTAGAQRNRGYAERAGLDHPRARRVPRGLRPRAGHPGQLRVLRQPDRGEGRRAGRRAAGGQEAGPDARCPADELQGRRAAARRVLPGGRAAVPQGRRRSVAGRRDAAGREARAGPRLGRPGRAGRPALPEVGEEVMADPITPVLTKRWLSPNSWQIGTYEAARGLHRRPQGTGRHAGAARPAGQGLRPARPRRRGLPGRRQVVASCRRTTTSRTTW